jgi:hypothetical protein
VPKVLLMIDVLSIVAAIVDVFLQQKGSLSAQKCKDE